MTFILHLFGVLCCLCSCAQSQNISGRPDAVNIGAQFARNSTIGRVAAVAVVAAVNDINNDPNILLGTKLDLKMHDSSCNRFLGIVQALQFMEKDTVAIIGPLSSTTAHVLSHLANELHVPLMSFSATDPTLSSLEYPFFVRTTVSDQFQMASVADLVEYYGWKQVTTIFVDNDYGRNGISSLGDELSKRRSKILYKAAFRPGATTEDLADVLIRVAMRESRVIILHANPDSGLVVFQQALKLGMMSSGYVWIATDWLTSYLDPLVHLDIGLLSTMQGVIALRHHTENTRRKSLLSSKWSELVEDSGHSRFLLSTYGLYAYDTVWILAHALDAFFNSGGNISFSPDPKLQEISGGGLNLEALSVFDGGWQLLERIHQVNFMGAAGPVKFDSGGNLIRPAYDIVNIVGSGLRTIGYWSNYSGLSVISPETLYMKPANRTRENQKLYDVIWPGEDIKRPRGWVFPNNGNELRIGVPDRVSYRQFVSADSETGMVRGLCIDVFVAAINLLAYPVPYKLIPFGNRKENPSYMELINKILTDDTRSTLGRFVIIIWLFVVLIIQSSYTASLTSILTVQQLTSPITGIDSLITSDDPIGFQVGSFAEGYLVHELGISHSRLKALGTPDEYKSALELGPSKKGGVAAIVDERPYVELFLYQNPNSKFAIVGSEFTKSGWGFAFPRDSPLSVDLSTAILQLSENGDLQRIHDKWLTSSMSPTNELPSDPDRLDVYSFSALFLICGLACIFALAIHACSLFYQYSRHAAVDDGAALPSSGASDGSRSLSRRSRLHSFLSFADRREIDSRRVSKEKEAALGASVGSMGGVSFTSSGSGSTTNSC
uniref:Glutamate receptor n=2 Tax=Leersia perrieri TaxID=77586 RepID=A0A0D9W8P3_9ORYZ